MATNYEQQRAELLDGIIHDPSSSADDADIAYRCGDCGIEFNMVDSLERHILMCRKKTIPSATTTTTAAAETTGEFLCTECEKTFHSRAAYVRHVQICGSLVQEADSVEIGETVEIETVPSPPSDDGDEYTPSPAKRGRPSLRGGHVRKPYKPRGGASAMKTRTATKDGGSSYSYQYVSGIEYNHGLPSRYSFDGVRRKRGRPRKHANRYPDGLGDYAAPKIPQPPKKDPALRGGRGAYTKSGAYRGVAQLSQLRKQGRRAGLSEGGAFKTDVLPSYVCFECDMVFSELDHLQEHVKRNAFPHTYNETDGFQFKKCTFCSQLFASILHLRNHWMIAHNLPVYDAATDSYNCPICGDQAFPGWNEFHAHILKHGLKAGFYPCRACEELFTRIDKRRVHEEEEHGQDLSDDVAHRFACERCGLRFPKMITLMQHLSKMFCCIVCPKSFSAIDKLVEHVTLEHRRLLSCVGKTQTDDCSIGCPDCDVAFASTQAAIFVHRCISHGVTETRGRKKESYDCDTCGDVFDTEGKLLYHQKVQHGTCKTSELRKKQNNLCELCGTRFQSTKELQMHTRVMHYHAAEDCGALFGEAVYCVYCEGDEACFENEAALKEHAQMEHAERMTEVLISGKRSGERWRCQHCKMQLTSQRDYDGHMLLEHSFYISTKCDLCNRAFVNAQSLSLHRHLEHLRRHLYDRYDYQEGEQLFCSICLDEAQETVFQGTEEELRRHAMAQHTEAMTSPASVQTWQCGQCAVLFAYKSDAIVHEKVAHPDIAAPSHECDKCRFFAGTPERLREHIDCLHDVCICPTCKAPIRGREALNKHCRASHGASLPQLIDDVFRAVTAEPETVYGCVDCPPELLFADYMAYWNHRALDHHLFECAPCGLAFESGTAIELHRQETHDDSPVDIGEIYVPAEMGSIFTVKLRANEEKMKAERRRVGQHATSFDKSFKPRKAKRFRCPYCALSRFGTKGATMNHVQRDHAKLIAVECSVCNRKMRNVGTLQEHLVSAHEICDPSTLASITAKSLAEALRKARTALKRMDSDEEDVDEAMEDFVQSGSESPSEVSDEDVEEEANLSFRIKREQPDSVSPTRESPSRSSFYGRKPKKADLGPANIDRPRSPGKRKVRPTQRLLEYRKLNESTNCKLCGETFEKKLQLKLHHHTVHLRRRIGHKIGGQSLEDEEVQVLYCAFCEDFFTSEAELMEHTTRRHDKVLAPVTIKMEAAFDCEICGVGFDPSDMEGLRMHYRNVHEISKEEEDYLVSEMLTRR